MKLYHCAGSRGLRALWTIEEMGLACELAMMPFPPRKQVAGYVDMNQVGTVPTLVDGDLVMTESSGIAHYLATRYGPSPLAVAVDDPDYGVFIDFLYHSDATLTFPQTVYLRYSVFEKHRNLGEAGELYAAWFAARLAKIAARLDGRAYLAAGRFTVADIAVGYALYLATRIGLGERIPAALHAWLATLTARDGFQRALAREAATPLVAGVAAAGELALPAG